MYWLLKIVGGQKDEGENIILSASSKSRGNYGKLWIYCSQNFQWSISSLDGVLTFDYLHGNIMDNGICLEYYSGDQNYQLSEEWSFIIKESDFELPINLIANFSDGVSVCIETLKEIKDLSEKNVTRLYKDMKMFSIRAEYSALF